MEGFLVRRVPLLARRAVTMLPAIILLTTGIDPTAALVISQVLLSFGIPFALIPLAIITSSHTIMGPHANRPPTTALIYAITTIIVGLNLYLLYRQLLG